MQVSELRRHLHGSVFQYDNQKFNFREILEDLYGCPLNKLHHYLGSYDRFRRSNDQSTLAHRVFYANFNKLIKPVYDDFVKTVINPIIVPAKAYYQVVPTFRIGLPGNTFVGEYHKDSDYLHQSYEINFNLGLSGYVGSSALKSETSPGSNEFITLECPYGSIFSFDHIDCLHGSDPNSTDETIVSFDFRLALKDLYYDSDVSSINMSTKFSPGSYFSAEPI